MNSFSNTNWLITGGSSGLGFALAENLSAQGAKVAIVARNERSLFEAAQKTGAVAIAGDVANKEDTYKIAGQAFAQLGRIDYLVNNASSLGPDRLQLLLDTDCESLEIALQTNVVAAFRLIKAVMPSLLLQGSGTIINISSDAAVNAYAKWGAYGASKASLDHLTRIWAEEVRSRGVSLLSIDPGDMATPLHRQAVPDADFSRLKDPQSSAKDVLAWIAQQPDSGQRKAV